MATDLASTYASTSPDLINETLQSKTRKINNEDDPWPAAVMAVSVATNGVDEHSESADKSPAEEQGKGAGADLNGHSSHKSPDALFPLSTSCENVNHETITGSSVSQTTQTRKRRDAMCIERCNLLGICKLVIKELIDLSLSNGCTLEDDRGPMSQFFCVMEHILYHGLKCKKGLLQPQRRECWSVIELISKHFPDSAELAASIKDMPNVKTNLGKVRAWLRLALMQKRLPDYFRLLVDRKDELLADHYEPWALMMSDELAVVAGLLVGLNIIDCNMALKDDDLEQAIGVIDYSLYLKEIMFQAPLPEHDSEASNKLATILDQKNYLEELNRHLTATVSNQNQKMEALAAANTLCREESIIAKSSILQLQHENATLRCENNALLDGHQRQLQSAQQDIQIERETYQQSRQGLDVLYQEVKKKLQDETQMRLDVEKELELQIGMKQEMEVALRLLEKDIHEKQDLIISLRKQLEEIKAINLEMYNRLQTVEGSLQHKADMVNRLEIKSGQMASTIRDMEDGIKKCQAEKHASDETMRKIGQQLADKDAKRLTLETDLKIEREWRGTLQRNFEQEKCKLTKLQTELQHLAKKKKVPTATLR